MSFLVYVCLCLTVLSFMNLLIGANYWMVTANLYWICSVLCLLWSSERNLSKWWMLIVYLTAVLGDIFFTIGQYLAMNLWIRKMVFFCNTAWSQLESRKMAQKLVLKLKLWFRRKTLRKKNLFCSSQSQKMSLIYYICLLLPRRPWALHIKWEFL